MNIKQPLAISGLALKLLNERIVADVMLEVSRASKKHPDWSPDNVYRASIIGEEAGEILRAANMITEGQGSIKDLREEVVQTAATCIRMLQFLEQDSINHIKMMQLIENTSVKITYDPAKKWQFMNNNCNWITTIKPAEMAAKGYVVREYEPDFWVECDVCKQHLKNWVGSTPCCGSIAYQVGPDDVAAKRIKVYQWQPGGGITPTNI
jgi:hypothetical protein